MKENLRPYSSATPYSSRKKEELSSRSSFIPLEVSRPRRLPFSKEKNGLLTGFTLIELLVVVAIIAILSVFVILTINPAELLKQGRDSQRVSDIATINSALNLYQVDAPNGSLGAASTTYISIPDNTATSTQGTQCQGLSLPALPTGWTYHCAASSTYRNTDGTGWIPVNFASISYGSPLGTLPTDPINSSSTAYYTYTPGGSWQLTAIPESQKIRTTQANQLTGAITQGSNLSLSPLFSSNGLVGYWKFDETSGATSTDSSGNGNNGTNTCTGATCSIPSWTSGKLNNALYFNPSVNSDRDYISISSVNVASSNGSVISISLWVNPNSSQVNAGWIMRNGWSGGDENYGLFLGSPSGRYYGLGLEGYSGGFHSAVTAGYFIPTGTWSHLVVIFTQGQNFQVYLNGTLQQTVNYSYVTALSAGEMGIGGVAGSFQAFNGYLDDVRIYNRALSAAEIMALYNATK